MILKEKHYILILILLAVLFFHELLNPFRLLYFSFSDILIIVGLKYDVYWASETGFPLWTKAVFSGMPLLGNSIYSVFYPLEKFFMFFQPEYVQGIYFFIHVLLIIFFMYFFMKEITKDKLTSFLSTLILVFSGWFIMNISAWQPLIFSGIPWCIASFYFLEKNLKNNLLRYKILLGISLALLFLASHLQYFIYSLIALAIYFLVKNLYNPKEIYKNTLKISMSVVVMILIISLPSLFFYQFYKYSNRLGGVDYWFATRISFPPYHFITALIPEFFGTPIDYSYLSTSNFWNLCIYIGIFPLILVLLSFLFKKNSVTAPFFVLLIFSLLFSMGQYTPMYYFFYKYIPTFNFFRAPSRFLFFYIFSVSVLAGIGFEELFKISNINRKKMSVVILLVLVTAIIAAAFVVEEKETIKSFFEREALKAYENYLQINSEWIQPLSFYLDKIERVCVSIYNGIITFILLLGVSLILLFFSKKFIGITKIVIIIFIFFDLWLFGFKYINAVPHDYVLGKTDLIDFFSNDTSKYRVLILNESLLPQHHTSKYKIEIVESGANVQLKNFKMFLDRIGNRSSEELISPMLSKIANRTLLNYLNVKYIVTSKELNGYELVYNGSGLIYRSNDYMQRTFFVDCEGRKDVKIVKDTSSSILLNVSNENPCKLVLSEVWYPGWNAYDNERKITVNEFEGALRYVNLEEGEHLVEFIYEPFSIENIANIFS